MSEELLRSALRALEASRADEARAALVAAWRRRRSPCLARLVELLDERWPDEIAGKLRAIVAPRAAVSLARLRELDELDDPRLGRFAVDSLVRLPFTTPGAQAFLEHLVDTALRLRDARLVEQSAAIREAVRVRIGRAPMRDALIEQVRRAAEELAARPPAAPDDRELSLEEELDTRLAPLGAPAATAEAFLAAIYADPDDDDARRVYADWLLERGDPRGELIALQLQRRDAGLGPEGQAREQELLKRHGKEWLGSLSPVVSFGKRYARSRFERCFLAVADIILSVGKKLEPLWEDPAWSTVEELVQGRPFELLERAPLRALRRIDSMLDVRGVEALARREERLASVRSVVLGDPTGIDRALLLEAFPGIHGIEVIRPQPALADVVAATRLGARRVAFHPYAGESEAAAQLFAELLDALENEAAHADELALTPPHARWPRPAPVVLRPSGGRWARVTAT